ncbi:nuclear transport factor 2 family protein [Sphingomonas sp. ZT3P38]|uniref:nuclear transport factor 2 family protein n=1 Tax=Parasphingomonas zepuensis TaxID=3096161 RepID=UPI002FC8DB9A
MPKLAIEDRLALQDLIADYSWALDTGDVEALVACFTPDARMVEEVFEDPDIWEGHDGIRGIAEHYRNAPGFPGRQHHVTQIQWFPQDDGSVKIRAFAFVTECHDEPPYELRFTGYYDDHAVKGADGKWRFQRRTVRLWDGEVLKRFPGRGQWVPRKRPASLILKR